MILCLSLKNAGTMILRFDKHKLMNFSEEDICNFFLSFSPFERILSTILNLGKYSLYICWNFNIFQKKFQLTHLVLIIGNGSKISDNDLVGV